MIAPSLSVAIADMAEESNLFTRLCRLPDSVTLQILTAYCYEDLHGDGLDANPDNGVFRLGRNWTKLTEVSVPLYCRSSAALVDFLSVVGIGTTS